MSIKAGTDYYGHALSHIHDTGFAGVAEAAADMLISTLKASGLTHGRVTDLGCGSGILARNCSIRATPSRVSSSPSPCWHWRSRVHRKQYSGAKRCSSASSHPRLPYVPLANVLTTASTATMTRRRWTAYCTACISHWKAVVSFFSTSLRRTGS